MAGMSGMHGVGACLPAPVRFASTSVTSRFAPYVATLLLAFASLNAAEPIRPQLTAEKTRLTATEWIATGEARLADRDIVLYADEISYRIADRTAYARGNVILIQGTKRLVADEVSYRYDDRTYRTGRFRVGEEGILAQGTQAEGNKDKLSVTGASLSYGEPEPLGPTASARTITYQSAGEKSASSMRVEGVRAGIGGVNFFPLPSFTESPDNPSLTGLDIYASYTGRLGAELGFAGTKAVSETTRLGADVGIFTKRGLLVGPIGDYDTFRSGEVGAKGKFRTGFIKDQGDTGLDIRSQQISSERGFIDWTHYQVVQPGTTLSGNLHYWSDSYVTRDFRSENFGDIQTPDTWFEADKAGDNYVVSLFSRVQVNDYSVVQERLPEVRFDGLPVQIGGGIYHRLNAGVAALREDDPFGTGTVRSDRADLYYGVNRPFSPREWFSFTPTAGTRITHYQRTPSASTRDSYTRVLGEVGFDSKLWESSATWNYQNKAWGINGLRHIATPRVSYRLSPTADVGRASIPAIDDDVFSTYLRPLGLADRRALDRLPALNTFRVGVDNTLQTRDPAYGSRDLVRLNVAMDQYADAEAARTSGQRRDQSDAHTFLELFPARWLRFDAYNRTTVQTGKLQELNTGLTLQDADRWHFRLGTHYLEDVIPQRGIQEYTADYGLRLNEIYALLLRFRYDSRLSQFTEQTYALRQRLSRLWILSYELSFYDGSRREDNFRLGLRVETKTF